MALTPDVAEAWLGRGNVLSALRRSEDALTAFERAVALRPDFPEAWLGRGNVLCDLKRHDEALAAFDQALALRPNLAAAWLGRGNVFYDRKRFADALAAYDRALAADANMTGAWVGRGDALKLLKRKSEAITAYQQALQLGGDPDKINFCLAGLGVGASPSTPPQRFVTDLFDHLRRKLRARPGREPQISLARRPCRHDQAIRAFEQARHPGLGLRHRPDGKPAAAARTNADGRRPFRKHAGQGAAAPDLRSPGL